MYNVYTFIYIRLIFLPRLILFYIFVFLHHLFCCFCCLLLLQYSLNVQNVRYIRATIKLIHIGNNDAMKGNREHERGSKRKKNTTTHNSWRVYQKTMNTWEWPTDSIEPDGKRRKIFSKVFKWKERNRNAWMRGGKSERVNEREEIL